jgi:catechol 2,3-dioxygenase-like lactoylglutathione lyase family enzyme
VWLALEGGFLALERAAEGCEPGGGERPAGPFRDGAAGLHLFALRIRPGERRSWEARLEAQGVRVVHRTRWTIYLRDPEGNRIGLSHHPEDPEVPEP